MQTKLMSFLVIGLSLVAFGQACGGFGAKTLQTLNSASVDGSQQPSADSPPNLKSWNENFPAPMRADNCLNNSSYNLCLTYKDPVSTYGSSLVPAFTPSSATATQEQRVFVYGVKVPTTALKNDFMSLNPGSFKAVTPTADGDWKHPYRGDTNHYVAQLHAWYWLNRTRSYFSERTGDFYAVRAPSASRLLEVHPYQDSISNNAYFDPLDFKIVLGFSTLDGKNSTKPKADLALDVAVAVHEMGHANFFAASPSSIYNDQTTKWKEQTDPRDNTKKYRVDYCETANGCPGAIHEGVGDFHAVVMFPDQSPTISNYFFNDPEGLEVGNLALIESLNVTADRLHNLSANNPGEIHLLGTVYASIWYGVWKKHRALGKEKQIEALFSDHLTGLGGSDTFITAFSTIKALAQQQFGAQASAIIEDFRTEYSRLGLVVN